MPAPDVYNAMQTGVIDGAMIDATTLRAFKLAEVTGSVTQGMETSVSDFFMIMNRDSFDAQSEANQQVLRDAGKQAALNGSAAWNAVAAEALAATISDPSLQAAITRLAVLKLTREGRSNRKAPI